MDLWEIERGLLCEGYDIICGVDEAGRGPLAGPVFAAAVILPINLALPGLNDSKKLSAAVREELFSEIALKSSAYAVASADNFEIDRLNILGATYLAMNRAISMLSTQPHLAIIDGNKDAGIELNSRCIVGGDGKSASIAAASILAKVCRDKYMTEMAELYQGYGFERHKGYGTKAHYEALGRLGPCVIHRETFLKKWNNR